MTETNGRYQRNRAAGNEKEKEKVKKYFVSFSRPSASRRQSRGLFALSAQDLRAFIV